MRSIVMIGKGNGQASRLGYTWNAIVSTSRSWGGAGNRPVAVKIRGHRFEIPAPSFRAQYRSIFLGGEYEFACDHSRPRILDLGGNYGLASLYFKTRYPDASIIVFEADPQIYQTLRSNLAAVAGGIDIRNQAVWVQPGQMEFVPNGLGGGTLKGNSTAAASIRIDTIDVKTFLAEQPPFDLIKMDIEGAETDVLLHAADQFCRSTRIIFEYHSVKHRPQRLGEILTALRSHGMRCYVRAEDKVHNPWIKQLTGDFDNRLVVYAHRDDVAPPQST